MMARPGAIRVRYLAALGALLAFALIQVLLLVRMTSDQRLVGLTVNLAGRQRMLSQRIPTLARDFVLDENAFVRAQKREVLVAAAHSMEMRHEQLMSGDPQVGPASWPPAAVRALYDDPPLSLDQQVRDFTARALHLADSPAQAMVIDNPDLNYLIARRDAILLGEDQVVNAYVADGELRQRIITRAIYALFGLEIVVVGVIWAFLFVPMERQIVQQAQALQRENEGLHTVVAGSQALAETLAIESLVARFVEGAERLLRVPVLIVAEPSEASLPIRFDEQLDALDAHERALVERSFSSRRLELSGDGTRMALAIDVYAREPRLAIVARDLRAPRPSDLVALEVFATNLQLAAHNASLYHDLEERETRVRELDQLKGDLIAMLAHDFRGPLTSIIGYAELMREGFIEGKDLDEAVNFIVKSAWRLSSLASDTLTMSQLERSDFALDASTVDIIELVRDTAQSSDRNRVRFTSAAAPVNVLGDSRRLRQAFENLIGNALKYSPGGEPVDVAVRQDGSRVRISIADRGIGIPGSELDRVFERFSRASNARASGINGTGFGLYLTKLIVEKHGGAIEVRSTEGSGSTFTVSLPALVVADPGGVAQRASA
jgi:signal transduction histidine kinase